jgi:hypothetical protein
MVYSSLGKKSISSILAMAFVISGCIPSDVPLTRQGFNATPIGESASGVGAGATTSGVGSGTTYIPPKVEIRHLIEPNLSTDPNYTSGTGYGGGGSYLRKLTLPKNFQGRLYLAGINIGTLSNRLVKVRFKFGVGRDAITIPAVVSSAPGITPQTNINVLVMDMRSEPFRNVRLTYDLFDYNEYSSTQTPVQDNRDTGLYCRGLRVEDDPTFVGVGQCDGLQPDEECLYAYAKVMDQGLVKAVVNGSSTVLVPSVPTLPQVKSVTGNAYYQDSMTQNFKKTLSDNNLGPFKFSEAAVPLNSTDAVSWDFLNPTLSTIDWAAKVFNSSNYYYRGPYRLVNRAEWHFKFADPVGTKKLFRLNSRTYTGPSVAVPEYDGSYTPGSNANGLSCSSHTECSSLHCNQGSCAIRKSIGSICSSHTECSSLSCNLGSGQCAQPKTYFGSYLFPLATQMNLVANVPHLSSAIWSGPRTESTLVVPGKTLWMDGSNARAQSKNSDLEHVGSCNVSATIEIIAKDSNGNEYIVSLSEDVKLQLVRPILHYTDSGNDVLYSNFKTCSSNASCGGSECCFNNRCWDETLVSQCYDSASTQGNRQVGEGCGTDLDCSSLCCNRSSGLCAPHNTILSPAVLCSKPIGDFCIAKDWCQKTPVVRCLVVKTGTNTLGDVTCRQQCYTTSEFGECKAGTCIAPFQDTIPVFDPNDPNACDDAVPAPSF